MKTIDEAAAAYEAGETWNDDDEVVELEVKRPLEKVIPVRFRANQWAAVRRAADAVGVGPSTLIRMWVLERLGAQSGRSLMRYGDAPPDRGPVGHGNASAIRVAARFGPSSRSRKPVREVSPTTGMAARQRRKRQR